MLIELGMTTTTIAALLLGGGTAQAAETPPECPSAVEIGSIGTLYRGGTVMGFVKQFEGCGGKFGYVNSKRSRAEFAEVRISSAGFESEPTRGELDQYEVWTFNADVNDRCTTASAALYVGEDVVYGASGSSC